VKYFTWQRYLALQNFEEEAMAAADADWEAAVEQYDAYLQTIRADLPEPVRRLLNGFYFHDAQVLSMGRRSDVFVITLQLDVPPNELVTITYTLAGAPEVIQQPPLADGPVQGAPLWQYEELELIRDGGRQHFVHSIQLDNGWELRLPFRDVQLTTAEPLYPPARTPEAPPTPPLAAPVT
jgi:hypothetical protein